MTLRITPIRAAILRHLADKGPTWTSQLVRQCMPRLMSNGTDLGWTGQGAARMAGAMINPLMAERLVTIERDEKIATITDKGRAALSDYALEELRQYSSTTTRETNHP